MTGNIWPRREHTMGNRKNNRPPFSIHRFLFTVISLLLLCSPVQSEFTTSGPNGSGSGSTAAVGFCYNTTTVVEGCSARVCIDLSRCLSSNSSVFLQATGGNATAGEDYENRTRYEVFIMAEETTGYIFIPTFSDADRGVESFMLSIVQYPTVVTLDELKSDATVYITEDLSSLAPVITAVSAFSSSGVNLAWSLPNNTMCSAIFPSSVVTFYPTGKDSNSLSTVTVTPAGMSITVSDLSSFTTYFISVAFNHLVFSTTPYTNGTVTTWQSAPTITTTSSTSNSITVEWNGLSVVEIYQVQVQGSSQTFQTEGRLYLLANLAPFTAYTIEVRGVDNLNRPGDPATTTVTTARGSPSLPRNVTVAARSDLTLEWLEPSVLGDDSVSYNVTITSSCLTAQVTTQDIQASFQTAGDPDGVSYTFEVLAYNSVGESEAVSTTYTRPRDSGDIITFEFSSPSYEVTEGGSTELTLIVSEVLPETVKFSLTISLGNATNADFSRPERFSIEIQGCSAAQSGSILLPADLDFESDDGDYLSVSASADSSYFPPSSSPMTTVYIREPTSGGVMVRFAATLLLVFEGEDAVVTVESNRTTTRRLAVYVQAGTAVFGRDLVFNSYVLDFNGSRTASVAIPTIRNSTLFHANQRTFLVKFDPSVASDPEIQVTPPSAALTVAINDYEAPSFVVHPDQNPPDISDLNSVLVDDYTTGRFNILQGAAFELSCTSNSQLNVLSWERDYVGTALPISGVGYTIVPGQNSSRIRFTNFSPANSGVYRCRAERVSETVRSNGVLLGTGNAMVGSGTEASVAILSQNKVVDLQVTVSGSYSEIVWHQGSTMDVLSRNSSQYMYQDFGRTLRLNSGDDALPLSSYAGLYTAMITARTNSTGVTYSAQRNRLVLVAGQTSLIESTSVMYNVNVTSDDGRANFLYGNGETLSLTCTSDNVYNQSLVWRAPTNVQPAVLPGGEEDGTLSSSQLQVPSGPVDGKYCCVVETTVAAASDSHEECVNVTEFDPLVPRNVSTIALTPPERLTLVVEANSEVVNSTEWSRDGEGLDGGDEEVYSKAPTAQDDWGNYTLRATSHQGVVYEEWFLVSRFAPLAVMTERTIIVVNLDDSVSTSVNLTCTVQGLPSPSGAFWLKRSAGGSGTPETFQPLSGSLTTTLFEGNATHPVVMLSHLTVQITSTGEFGYRCAGVGAGVSVETPTIVIYSIAYEDPCAAASCSQECVPTGPSSRRCQCREGFHLDAGDSATCREDNPSVVATVTDVQAVTGDIVTLSCTPSGVDPSQTAIQWRLNGTLLNGGMSITNGAASTASPAAPASSDLGHTYTLNVARPSVSGWYSCELVAYPDVSANVTVSIAPGCNPYPFLPNSAVGVEKTIPCNTIHPGFNSDGYSKWKCANHLEWEGDYSRCTFRKEHVNPLVLLRFFVFADLQEVLDNSTAYEAAFNSYISSSTVSNSFTIVQNRLIEIVRTESSGSVGFTFVMEITPNSQFSRLERIDPSFFDMSTFTILGKVAIILRDETYNFVPRTTCPCPVRWSDISQRFGKGNWPNVTLCQAATYVGSPCNCDTDFGEQCVCGDLYTTAGGECTVDEDKDGRPDYADNCISCCSAEVYRGISWPLTPHAATARISCGDEIDPLFNRFSYTTRYCSPATGAWAAVDSTGCTAAAQFSSALLVFTGTFSTFSSELPPDDYAEEELETLYDQYNLIEIRSLDLRPGSSFDSQIATAVLRFPSNVSSGVLYAHSPTKRGISSGFYGVSVYGYRAADDCSCESMPREITTFYGVCTGPQGSPCSCAVNSSAPGTPVVCQCLPGYAEVQQAFERKRRGSESGTTIVCAVDSDGDGIANSEDNCPDLYDPTNQCLVPSAMALTNGCPAEVDQVWQISWPATPRGNTSTLQCSTAFNSSNAVTGLVTRICGENGEWRQSNIMSCQNLDFVLVQQNNDGASEALSNNPAVSSGSGSGQVAIGEAPLIIIRSNTVFLAAATAPLQRPLFPRDLGTVNNFLSVVANYAEETTLLRAEYNVEEVIDIVNNVLDSSTDVNWSQLDEDPSNGGSPQLLESAERISLSFATSLTPNETNRTGTQGIISVTIERPNAVFVGMLVDVNSLEKETVSIVPEIGSTFQEPDKVPSITLPIAFLRERAAGTNSNYTPVATSVIRNLQFILPLRYSNGSVPRNSSIGSIIISTQVSTFRGYSSSLEGNPIVITFPINSNYSRLNEQSQKCVFWHLSSGNYSFSGWSDVNVSGRDSGNQGGDRVCLTTHLTSFAVLVDVSGLTTQLSQEEALAFSIISYFGCAVSLLCLLATAIFLLTLRKELITKVINYVHFNLCISLMCGLIVFVAGIEAGASSRAACAIVAVLLHYFFLAAFSWMLCEGIILYNSLVKVFGANQRKWIYIFTALGWSIPVPFVVISVASRWALYRIPKSYDPESSLYQEIRACWLPHEQGVIAAFIVPMLAIVIINVVFMCLALRSLYRFKRDQVKRTNEDKAGKQAAIAVLKGFVILVPLLGVTWIIGLLAVNPYTTVFAWLFLFLNAFQGVFIFFFHVVRHDKVWPKLIGCVFGHKKYKPTSSSNATNATGSTLKGRLTKISSRTSTFKPKSAKDVEMGTLKTDSVVEENVYTKNDPLERKEEQNDPVKETKEEETNVLTTVEESAVEQSEENFGVTSTSHLVCTPPS